MKYALITDTHAGVRSDADNIANFQKKFYLERFFPFLHSIGVNHILHLGDFFDKRQHLTIKTIDTVKQSFLQPLKDYNMHMTMILGNHDVYYRNTNELNGAKYIFDGENVTLVQNDVLEMDNIIMVPWINRENYDYFVKRIADTDAKYLMGHLEISGFEMHKGSVCESGLNSSLFSKFEKVFSGHFHTRSTKGNITYLGSTFQYTWSDYNEDRGFYIFDSETGELEFYPNEDQLFYKMEYISNGNYKWTPDKPKSLTDKIIKMIYTDVSKHKLEVNRMTDKLIADGVYHVQAVEKMERFINNTDEIINSIGSKSNLEIMIDHIMANQDYSNDTKSKLVEYAQKLYTECNINE